MQVLVLYYSRTGNTQKLAAEIAKGVEQVNGITCIVRSVETVTKDDMIDSGGIIVGSPVYFGSMAGS